MVGILEQIFTTENSTNKELGKQIRNEIDQLASRFMELDDQENKILLSKKSIILEIADKFERLYEIGEFPLPIYRIGSQVLRYLQIKGYNISKTHVYDVIAEFAPQYIDSEYSYQSVHSGQIDIKIKQQKIIDSIAELKKKEWKALKKEQVQDAQADLYDIIDSLNDFMDENTIISSGDTEEYVPHYDSSEADPFKDPVITDTKEPEPRESNLSNATHELADSMEYCAKVIRANAKMMERYPPEPDDMELEVKGVKMIKEWASWFKDALAVCFKSGTDRKYRRSIFEWVKIAQDEDDWGKHAASSKNPYTAKFIDPKTGKWTEETRKLTREQIGDKSPKVRAFTKTFNRLIPAAVSIIRWSERELNPYTNGESVKLGPKLSDRSLR